MLKTPAKPLIEEKNDIYNDEYKQKQKIKRHNRLRSFGIMFLSVVISLCTGISLYCGYALIEGGQPIIAEISSPQLTATHSAEEKEPLSLPLPVIVSVDISDTINDDFTRTVKLKCKNNDDTENGLRYYISDKEQTDIVDTDHWNTTTDGEAEADLSGGEYYVYVTNDSGELAKSDKITVKVDAVTSVEIGKTDTYMNVGMNYSLCAQVDTVGKPGDKEKAVTWKSSAPQTVSVNDGVISALKAGKATVTATTASGLSDSVEITVTDLLRAPKITAYKPLLPAGQYTEEEGALIDAVLESRVNTAGYGTRAGVVAAARFIPLEFNYKIPYFYENGRLDPQPERPYCDGEGRFYHKGLYLTHSKFELLDKKGILYGPATWGEPLTNWENAFGLVPGAKYANGMTCSGFVSWCLYNGGVPLGDVGAGDTPDYDYEYSDFGKRVWLDEDVMRSGILQVGDLIGCDGHIAIIAGFDENNIYIAEALGKGIVMEVRERYREVWECGDYTYAMLMGDIYAEHNGDGDVTEMWADYSE